MPLPFDQDTGVTIQISALLAMGTLPLHLSPARSVNISKITSYEHIEMEDGFDFSTLEDDPDDPPQDVPPRTLAPAIFVEGNSEPMILTKMQNKLFRPYWNNYAKLAEFLFAAVNQIAAGLATTEIPAPAAPAPGGAQ
jgi:hypothetical protein